MGGAGRSPTPRRPCCATRGAARRSWRPCSCPWRARPRVRPARCSTTFPPTTRRAGPGRINRSRTAVPVGSSLAVGCGGGAHGPDASRALVAGTGRDSLACWPSVGGEEHTRVEGAARRPHAENARLRDASDCPEPDARLLTAHVELAHVDEVAWRAQEGLASRIRHEN